MSTIWFQGPNLPCFLRNGNQFQRATASPKLNLQLRSSHSHMQEDYSLEFRNPTTPELQTSTPDTIRFDRLQTSDEQGIDKIEFGQYVAREALVDEEYWTAAWLRAESHYEDRPPERYTDSYKRKFADQEFNALKRRCSGKHIENCTCIVAFLSNYQIRKEEKNVKRTVIKSIVGTLDLSIRNLLQGEIFPRVNVKAPTFGIINGTSTNRYGYIGNVCVSRFARRKGIASNMLSFAIQCADSKGVEHVFVHVHRENTRAQDLYKKIGFQIVEIANSNLVADENYLMRFKL